jgi:hypothetical protein
MSWLQDDSINTSSFNVLERDLRQLVDLIESLDRRVAKLEEAIDLIAGEDIEAFRAIRGDNDRED